jgi:hypothetical protein
MKPEYLMLIFPYKVDFFAIAPSQTEKPQIAQINADSIAFAIGIAIAIDEWLDTE